MQRSGTEGYRLPPSWVVNRGFLGETSGAVFPKPLPCWGQTEGFVVPRSTDLGIREVGVYRRVGAGSLGPPLAPMRRCAAPPGLAATAQKPHFSYP